MSKLLGEFLQEQQEPFALEIYLLESGYLKSTSLNSESNFIRGSTSSSKIINRSASNGLKRRKYGIPSCSKLVKGVFTRLVPSDKKYRSGDQKKIAAEISSCEEDDKFSTASSTTAFNSCSESDANDVYFSKADAGQKGNHLSIEEVAADTKLKWRAVEENKQHSPVSVLEETETESDGDNSSPLHYKQYNNGESSTSFSPCKVMKTIHYGVQGHQKLIGSNSSYQYMKNKRALQETKQLLFDCVREVVENHRKNDKRGENLKKILGPEELWKIVCENVWLWSQDSINEANIIDLLHYDFLASTQEWGDYEQQKKDISMEVGDAILDQVMNETMVNFVT